MRVGLAGQTSLGVASVQLASTALSGDGHCRDKDEIRGWSREVSVSIIPVAQRDARGWEGGRLTLAHRGPASCPHWSRGSGAPSGHARDGTGTSATANSPPPSPTLAFGGHPSEGAVRAQGTGLSHFQNARVACWVRPPMQT
uniref:Uncharacterized protein n=1 Tax=Pipistrellus kuhlii TaxID=59472 RepID=A0A7J7X0T0_PIPKU|nr:hypothetical protein mPipKuh1_010721 [Pipistrellus kuhlii]